MKDRIPGEARVDQGVNRWTASSLVVANMIGTGVFTSLGFQAAALPSVFPLVLLWVIGGVFALCGALSYAELAAALPRSGGEFHFLSRIFHPAVGFVAGWTSITVGFAAPVALAAMAFGRYGGLAFPGLNPSWASAGIVVAVMAAHLIGLKSAAVFQNVFTCVKLLLVLTLLIAGLLVGEKLPIAFAPAPGDWGLIAGAPFAVSLIYVMYAYSGWNASTYIAGEIREPSRSLPWSLWVGTLVVTVLYVGVNALFLSLVPIGELAGQLEVAGIAAMKLFGVAGGRIMSGMIGVALVSCISAMTWAGSRIAQVMGEDHRSLRFLSIRSRSGVPSVAIVLQTLIACGLIFSSTFDRVMAYTQFTLNLCALLTVGGLFVLRWKAPELPRPYRVWGYPVVPLLFVIIATAMLVFVLGTRPKESLAGLATMCMGLLFYRPAKRLAPVAAACLLLVPSGLLGEVDVRRATAVEPANRQPADAADSADQIARFLAGVDPGGSGAAAALAADPRWKRHSDGMAASWERFDEGRLREIRRWSSGELQARVPATVFYPFSGPDFTYAYSFFPHARRYVLCGLEPPGEVPQVGSLRDPFAVLDALRGSFGTLLKAGYFVTKNLSSDLKAGEMRGTLPVFYVMLARAGCRINSVEAGGSRAVVRFEAPGGGGERVLEYYSQDLSNAGLGGKFQGYVRGLGPMVTFVKSASYLMHRESFSAVRRLVLDASQAIIQDDSGVPLRHFDRGKWTLRFFGAYTPPLDIFKEYNQPDLAALYASMGGVQDVKFGFGYRWDPKEVVVFVAVAKH
jgi:APA family basic amino acid/polyamine antiporter